MHFVSFSIVVMCTTRITLFLFNVPNRPWLHIDYSYKLKIIRISCLIIWGIGFEHGKLICKVVYLVALKADDMAYIFANFTGVISVKISS